MTTSLATYGPVLGPLAQWVERQLADGATRLILRQKSDSGEQLVREFAVIDAAANPLADEVYRKAEDDGRHFRGRSLYGVFAFRERDYVDRFFFAIEGEEDQAYFGQREANLAGVTTQLMRHNEANARLAIGQTLDVISHYKLLLAAREKRIEELEAKYWKVVELYERLTSMQHERELVVKRLEQAEKRQEFLREKLDMLAPVLMSKIVPGANKGALGEELIRQLLKSLSPEQMQAIVGALSPEQAAVINEVYVAYGEREIAKDEAKKTSSKKTVNATNGVANH